MKREGRDPVLKKSRWLLLKRTDSDGGSGPAVTAACILADFFENDEIALRFCGAFKVKIIANLPRCSTWLTGSQILEALENLQIEWEKAGGVSW